MKKTNLQKSQSSKNNKSNHRSIKSTALKKNFSRKKQKSHTFDKRSHRNTLDPIILTKNQALIAYKKTKDDLKKWKKSSIKNNPNSLDQQSLDRSFHHRLEQLSNIPLDPWQQSAINQLKSGNHVIIDAPTSAGKTRIFEVYLANRILTANNHKFRACYTSPIKSLANDKFKELCNLFGENYVGISTGDIKINLDAPIIISTLESYRNSLLSIDSIMTMDLIIFDEYHFINDFSRGSAWQEALILSEKSSQFLLLSASAKNPQDFVKWISSINNKPTTLVSCDHRPVPLKDVIFNQGKWIICDHIKPQLKKHQNITPKKPAFRISLKTIINSIIAADRLELSPILVYCGKKHFCEQLCSKLTQQLTSVSTNHSHALDQNLQKIFSTIPCKDLFPPILYKSIVHYGIAYHHSGLSPPVKLCIESLLKGGYLRVCLATSGLSMGINFSVKSSMVVDYFRPGDQGIKRYTPSEILQMSGRAGRRGIDIVGYTLWPNIESYSVMGNPHRSSIIPTLRHEPSTILALIDKYDDLNIIETLFNKSFDNFHKKRSSNKYLFSDKTLKKLFNKSSDLPCYQISPTYSYLLWNQQNSGACKICTKRDSCHSYVEHNIDNDNHLWNLHLHLHSIKALDSNDQLSSMGSVAKYLPHGSGLFIAKLIDENIGVNNSTKLSKKTSTQKTYSKKKNQITSMLDLIEVIACISIAHYKPINTSRDYTPVLSDEFVLYNLHRLYPPDLFPNLYEKSKAHENYRGLIYIEYNPMAGALIRKWCDYSIDWDQLCTEYCNKYLAQGDIFALINKVSSYLKSIYQAQLGDISDKAQQYITLLMRHPIDFLDYALK